MNLISEILLVFAQVLRSLKLTLSRSHWKLFSVLPDFRQLFIMYLALRKCKNDCKMLKNFCPLKPDISRFSLGFRLNIPFQSRVRHQTQSENREIRS